MIPYNVTIQDYSKLFSLKTLFKYVDEFRVHYSMQMSNQSSQQMNHASMQIKQHTM